ncbi:MAG: hypothetical protein OET63_05760 [Desulfobacterales bacterium]|jgi:hypothetical protein|nr:hypothetical protein [Desulfobacterales bacterium]
MKDFMMMDFIEVTAATGAYGPDEQATYRPGVARVDNALSSAGKMM